MHADDVLQHYMTASLGVVTAANVPEILREAGPNVRLGPSQHIFTSI